MWNRWYLHELIQNQMNNYWRNHVHMLATIERKKERKREERSEEGERRRKEKGRDIHTRAHTEHDLINCKS